MFPNFIFIDLFVKDNSVNFHAFRINVSVGIPSHNSKIISLTTSNNFHDSIGTPSYPHTFYLSSELRNLQTITGEIIMASFLKTPSQQETTVTEIFSMSVRFTLKILSFCQLQLFPMSTQLSRQLLVMSSEPQNMSK
jgi:hypothetical protein